MSFLSEQSDEMDSNELKLPQSTSDLFEKGLLLLLEKHNSEVQKLQIENIKLKVSLQRALKEDDMSILINKCCQQEDEIQNLKSENRTLLEKYNKINKKHGIYKRKLTEFLEMTQEKSFEEKNVNETTNFIISTCKRESLYSPVVNTSNENITSIESTFSPQSLQNRGKKNKKRNDRNKKRAKILIESPIRKKKILNGFDCNECQEFYLASGILGNCLHEKQKHLNEVSRHRHLYSPKKTPPKFWDLTFPNDIQ